MTDHADIPSDLVSTAQAIDRLARAEADSAAQGLERRLMAATVDLVTASPEAPVVAVIGRRNRALAFAAGVGLVATLAITWIAMNSPSTPGDVPAGAYASDLDLFLSITADDGDLRGKFDVLLADTAALEADMRSGVDAWSTFDDGGSL